MISSNAFIAELPKYLTPRLGKPRRRETAAEARKNQGRRKKSIKLSFLRTRTQVWVSTLELAASKAEFGRDAEPGTNVR
jgi:hypothetical protein